MNNSTNLKRYCDGTFGLSFSSSHLSQVFNLFGILKLHIYTVTTLALSSSFVIMYLATLFTETVGSGTLFHPFLTFGRDLAIFEIFRLKITYCLSFSTVIC